MTFNSLFLLSAFLYYGAMPVKKLKIKVILLGYAAILVLGSLFTWVKYNIVQQLKRVRLWQRSMNRHNMKTGLQEQDLMQGPSSHMIPFQLTRSMFLRIEKQLKKEMIKEFHR